MQRKIWLVVLATTLLFGPLAGSLSAASKSGVDERMIRLLVVDKASGKEEVKLTFPVALLEWAGTCCKEEKIQLSEKCRVSLKQLLDMLQKSGNQTLLEVDEESKRIKIWFE
ncbi:MAG: hypothetical protein RB296_01960 [Acidobacteriota bacterium]|jgi:hypothetical protein|nr:hypothetical protein [Acidobacteriota bacterium]